jgi:hypothetical protein
LSLLQCPWVAEIMDIITFVNCSVYYAKKNWFFCFCFS